MGGILATVCMLFSGLAQSINITNPSQPSQSLPPTPTQLALPTPLEHKPISAMTQCRQYVRSRLKVPSSAQFTNEKAYGRENKSDNYHAVTGLITSQNSFGVPLTSYFRCDVHYTPEKPGDWILDSLTIEQ